jgi:aspartyl-tRNA(Asn)/glutamyl-tRNA(Gln) amidotransferase subunit C
MIPGPEKPRAASHFHRSSGPIFAVKPIAVKLTRQNVEQIAHLARLEIGPEELDGVVEKLGRIVQFVDQLQLADTSAVVPMAHPMDMSQRLRADVVTETNHRDLYQQNSEAVADGLYLVPRVLE